MIHANKIYYASFILLSLCSNLEIKAQDLPSYNAQLNNVIATLQQQRAYLLQQRRNLPSRKACKQDFNDVIAHMRRLALQSNEQDAANTTATTPSTGDSNVNDEAMIDLSNQHKNFELFANDMQNFARQKGDAPLDKEALKSMFNIMQQSFPKTGFISKQEYAQTIITEQAKIHGITNPIMQSVVYKIQQEVGQHDTIDKQHVYTALNEEVKMYGENAVVQAINQTLQQMQTSQLEDTCNAWDKAILKDYRHAGKAIEKMRNQRKITSASSAQQSRQIKKTAIDACESIGMPRNVAERLYQEISRNNAEKSASSVQPKKSSKKSSKRK